MRPCNQKGRCDPWIMSVAYTSSIENVKLPAPMKGNPAIVAAVIEHDV